MNIFVYSNVLVCQGMCTANQSRYVFAFIISHNVSSSSSFAPKHASPLSAAFLFIQCRLVASAKAKYRTVAIYIYKIIYTGLWPSMDKNTGFSLTRKGGGKGLCSF
jgi:hypothetical protein